MTVETDEERGAMLEDFGLEATYTPNGGSPVLIPVIFDKEYIGVDATGEVVVESRNPKAIALSRDVTDADHEATLEIDSVVYNVVGVHPDGQGMTELILEVN